MLELLNIRFRRCVNTGKAMSIKLNMSEKNMKFITHALKLDECKDQYLRKCFQKLDFSKRMTSFKIIDFVFKPLKPLSCKGKIYHFLNRNQQKDISKLSSSKFTLNLTTIFLFTNSWGSDENKCKLTSIYWNFFWQT